MSYPPENPKHGKQRSSVKISGRRRKGSVIWTVMPKHRHQCDASVNGCAQANPGCDHVENGVIDVEKEHSEAREEEEEREV